MRDSRSFKCASNMLSGRQSFRYGRLGWLVALLQREINLVRHRGAGIAARSALLGLEHDDDDEAGVFVRREGGEPDRVADHFSPGHYLRSSRLGANPQAWDESFLARAFRVFHVGEHGLADNVEAALADVQLAADTTGREGNRRLVREGVMGVGPGLESRREQFCYVVYRGFHDSVLQWRIG